MMQRNDAVLCELFPFPGANFLLVRFQSPFNFLHILGRG